MRVVSTVHKAGWEAYGDAWLGSLGRYWQEADVRLYTEGFAMLTDGAPWDTTCIPTEEVQRLAAFKEKYAHYKTPTWTTDIDRW